MDYLMDDGQSDKNAKAIKMHVIKMILKFNGYKNCLFKNKIIINHNKDLKVKPTMYILKKLTRLN